VRGSDVFGEAGVFDGTGVLGGSGVVSVGTRVAVEDVTAVSVAAGGVSVKGRGVSDAGIVVAVTVEVGATVGVSAFVCVGVTLISSAFAENTFRGALNKIAAARKRRAMISILGLNANILPPVCNQELAPD
jgi:hypothetical protein